MMQSTPYITLDFKKNRIRIFKSTVLLMGTPDYVQLLVNPGNRIIALKSCDESDPCSQKIKSLPRYNKDEYELYSKALLQRLLTMNINLSATYAFKIPGRYIETESLCVFDVNQAERIENE